MAERFYWLKLKRDFFKRHDIRIIEGMPNGKDYVLFYLKLLCESVDHDGNLRFNERIPYNEEMLATITNTNVDIVRAAVKMFTQLGMMELMDDGTFFMTEVQKMVGFETEWAEKKRQYREKLRQKEDNVLQLSETEKTLSDKSKSKNKSKSKSESKNIEPTFDGIADSELKGALEEFVKFRKSIKKPMSEHAINLLMSKLAKLARTDEEKVEILNQSILNGWQGVFPIERSRDGRTRVETYKGRTAGKYEPVGSGETVI